MKTVTEKPEHQPSESHTLDEVLKSLQDLVRGELLDAEPKPPPPPRIQHGKVGRPRKPRPEPAAPPAAEPPIDIDSVMRSLKSLVSGELAGDELAGSDGADAEPSPAAETTVDDTPGEPETPIPETAVASGAQHELLLESPAVPEMIPDAPVQSADDIIRELESMVHEEARHHAPAAPEPAFSIEFAGGPPASIPEPPGELVLDASDISDEDTLTLDDFATPAPRKAAEPEPMTKPESSQPFSIDFEPPGEIVGSDFLTGPDPAQDPDVIDIVAAIAPPTAEKPQAPDTPAPEPMTPEEPPTDEIVLDDTLVMDEPQGASAEESSPASPETQELDLVLPDNPETPEPLADELLTPPDTDEPQIEIAEQPLPPAEKEDDVPILGESVNFDDLPVLSDVVVPAATLEPLAPEPPKTAELPFGPPEQVRQLAIRVVAKLNIELRKAGERPLAARTVDRLQYILGEEIERLGRESGKR